MPTLRFSIGVFFYLVIDHRLVAEYFTEPANIFTAPAIVHLSVLAEFTVHKVIWRFDSCYGETIRHQLHKYITGNITLRVFQVVFNIPHHRIENLSFMKPVAIKL